MAPEQQPAHDDEDTEQSCRDLLEQLNDQGMVARDASLDDPAVRALVLTELEYEATYAQTTPFDDRYPAQTGVEGFLERIGRGSSL